jgi:hypothetical protein
MTSHDLGWAVANFIAQWLEPEEREAVLGDLVESGRSARSAALDIFGLIVRRQFEVWKTWRPWLASFGLALPASFLLMGYSLSVSRALQQVISPAVASTTGFTPGPGFSLLLCNVLLLLCWSWSGGFVVGSLSRRTLWVSAILTFAPCIFCVERFRVERLSRLCLLLFLPPAIWGVSRGLAIAQLKRRSAFVLALVVTVLTIPTWASAGPWIPNWALSWPAWYLVATARKTA